MNQKDLPRKVNEVDQELRGKELSLSACQGVGNRPPSEKKIANARGVPAGGGGGGREKRVRKARRNGKYGRWKF